MDTFLVCLFLPKEKNMPKLKTINISGCHELQYLYRHQNLKKVLLCRRMAENGFAPPLGNFADISYLIEN